MRNREVLVQDYQKRKAAIDSMDYLPDKDIKKIGNLQRQAKLALLLPAGEGRVGELQAITASFDKILTSNTNANLITSISKTSPAERWNRVFGLK